MIAELPTLVAIASQGRTWAIVLGILALIVSIALIVASWTRWGQTKSLTKCVVLAVLAHVWLLMYAYGTRVIAPGIGGVGSQGSTTIQLSLSPMEEVPVEDDMAIPEMLETPEQQTVEEKEENSVAFDAKNATDLGSTFTTEPPPLLPAPEPAMEDLETKPTEQPTLVATNIVSTTMEAPSPESPPVIEPVLPSMMDTATHSTHDTPTLVPMKTPTESFTTPTRQTRIADQQPIPEAYQNRSRDRRMQAAIQYGGDPDTEASVEAALQWLASVQEVNGSWSAFKQGAGKETRTLGEDRGQAGAKADTGITGLAVLAFLGGGYTHLEGPYQATIQNALEFLIEEQFSSGDLSGRSQVGGDRGVYFARMYCHGMALFAVAEAYALTGDPRLARTVQQGLQYTLQSQNARSGGWRYLPREEDPGDLSQFGWQAMAIKSSQAGGFPPPHETHGRLVHFLDLVKAGKQGGLATYRPNFVLGQRPSPAMTAEALACRMLLNARLSVDAEQESLQLLMNHLPGSEEVNLYYWYYATLAMFQFQDKHWQTWNNALKNQLLTTQHRQSSALIGSWDPNCIWGGYGGRVYSTAMACMCFEVYYRYLPMYRQQDIQMGSVPYNSKGLNR